MEHHRIASWWFRWEDFNYPDSGIKDKLLRRAEKFEEAGINYAFVFGFHCRWDYIYCFDRVHELLRLSSDACHEHGIKFFDHYSATLIHRPRSMEGEWKLYREGRNRMTFHPSIEMAETLAWKSSKLNDWRMLRIQDDSVPFIDRYQAEIFCINNPEFRKASAEYLVKLHNETGIDGLVFDDGGFYPGWESCGCPHCRALFKERSGIDLPQWQDISFWGNYSNPYFREWVRFRYDSAAHFLDIPRELFGVDFPLSACCCSTAGKFLDEQGFNVHYFSRAINYIELEMCGEISSGADNGGFLWRIPDMLIHRAVAASKNSTCFGIGYLFCSDAAFLLWALCKLLGVDCWVSTGKGRVNVTTAEMSLLPNEEDVIGEAYNYEKSHPELFEGKPDSSCAIFFSSSSKINHGDSRDDYETAFSNLTKSCFEANLPVDVIVSLDDADKYPILALTDAICLSTSEREILKLFMERGGIVIASGPLGMLDEHGDSVDEDFLSEFSLSCHLADPERPNNADVFFAYTQWLEQPRNIPDTVEVISDAEKQDGFYSFQLGKGQLYWSPCRLNNTKSIPGFLGQLQTLLPPTYRVDAPVNMRWQAFRHGDDIVIHFLNTNFSQVPHPKYCYLNKPIGEALNYVPPTGKIVIYGRFTHAEMFSPDFDGTRIADVSEDFICINVEGVRRFCSVRLTRVSD